MGLNKDLGFTPEDRKENIRRIAEVAALFKNSGTMVCTAFISPYQEDRYAARSIIGDGFVEVFVKAPLETCEERDPKGLYKKARSGEIPNFTGVSAPYEEPHDPEITVNTSDKDLEECANQIIDFLEEFGYITHNKGEYKMSTRRAMFVGRWQPFHNGHKWLINQKLSEGEPILIAVRDIPPDEKNPFTTEQTVEMIEEVYKNENVVVISIPDISSVNYGRGVGYGIIEHCPPKDVGFISATSIRERIYKNDQSWKENMDSSIHDLVVEYLTDASK
jgi:adenylylsulfate kinase